jgi:hypothetical protein
MTAVQFQAMSYSCWKWKFHPSSFVSPLLITIPQLLHNHQSPAPEVRVGSNNAAPYHILGQVGVVGELSIIGHLSDYGVRKLFNLVHKL